MSAFLTDLNVKLLHDADGDNPRATWRLNEPLVFRSDRFGRDFVIPAGFVTDFASVPRIPVAWYLAGGESNKAATLHDYLYNTHIVSRADADAAFEEAMAATGQGWWHRKAMWAAVRVFGGTPYHDDFETREEAP